MKERNRYTIPTARLCPGDRLTCTVRDKGQVHQFTEDIGRHLEIDTVVTFDIESGDCGLEDGIGAVFGKQVVR